MTEELAMKRRKGKVSSPDIDPWESGDLGRSAEHAEIVDDAALNGKIDEALGLQMISIRLERSTIESFKFIAARNKGIGYQTLMRQALKRFAMAEMKQIARELDRELKKSDEVQAERKKAA